MRWYPLGVSPEIKVPTLPSWAPQKLLNAARLNADTPEAKTFLEDVAMAIGAATARQEHRETTTPAALRQHLSDVERLTLEIKRLTTEFSQKLDLLRSNGNFCRLFQGEFRAVDDWFSRVQGVAPELFAAITGPSVVESRVDDLPSGGNLTDYTRRHLAADIAEALHNAGISPTVSRPKMNRHGKSSETRFCAVLRVAIRLFEGKEISDPYPSASAGLKLFRQGCKDYLEK